MCVCVCVRALTCGYIQSGMLWFLYLPDCGRCSACMQLCTNWITSGGSWLRIVHAGPCLTESHGAQGSHNLQHENAVGLDTCKRTPKHAHQQC